MRRIRIVLLIVTAVIVLGLTVVPAAAYNQLAHEWIIRKAVMDLKNDSASIAGTYPLDTYLPYLLYGASYADNPATKCTWTYGVDSSQVFGCDLLHHYGQVDDIKFYKTMLPSSGVTIGHPGEFAAPYYAYVLYDQAVRFWPGGDRPDLSRLPYLKAGTATILGDTTDLLGTYVGGLPTCELYETMNAADRQLVGSCPMWPEWASADRTGKNAQENVSNAMTYLGWSLHLVEDMSVPVHVNNRADEMHASDEAKMDAWIADGEFDHLPVPQDRAYVHKPCGECIDGEYWYAVSPYYYSDIGWSIEQFALEAQRITQGSDTGRSIQPSYEEYRNEDMYTESGGLLIASQSVAEVNTDTSIKIVAAIIEKYFRDLSLADDTFEPNDRYDQAQAIVAGRYEGLTISGPRDEDWYIVHVGSDTSDLVIDIVYNQPMGALGAAVQSATSDWAGVPQETSTGARIEMRGIAAGDYRLHIYSAVEQPVPYALQVAISSGSLAPDSYEENDDPASASPFFIGCDFTNTMTIDTAGDDDYYTVTGDAENNVSVGITFDPSRGDLHLFVNGIEARDSRSESSTRKTVGLSTCGSGEPILIRITGDRNVYSLCVGERLDTVCGYVPPQVTRETARIRVTADAPLGDVHILSVSDGGHWANLFVPDDVNGDGGGDIVSGESAAALPGLLTYTGNTHYILVGTTDDSSRLVLSSPGDLTGSEFGQRFSDLNFTLVMNDLADGSLSDTYLNPCRSSWEIAQALGLDCRSPFVAAGEPDGVLLTPLGEESTLYAFPGGDAVGTIAVDLEDHAGQA